MGNEPLARVKGEIESGVDHLAENAKRLNAKIDNLFSVFAPILASEPTGEAGKDCAPPSSCPLSSSLQDIGLDMESAINKIDRIASLTRL